MLAIALGLAGLAHGAAYDSGAAVHVSVRLHNEVSSAAWAALMHGNATLANTTAQTTSPYASAPCNETLHMTLSSGEVASVGSLDCSTGRPWSVLAVGGGPGDAPLLLDLLQDRVAVLPDDYIDTGRMRVLNGFTGMDSVLVRAWTSECYHCLLPELAKLPAGSGMGDYAAIATQHEYVIEVERGDVNFTKQEAGDRAEVWTLASESDPATPSAGCTSPASVPCTTLWVDATAAKAAFVVSRFHFKEHGVYDAIITNTAPPRVRLVVNAGGNDVNTPLWVAAVVAVCLGVAYHLGKAVYARLALTQEKDDFLTVDSVHVSGGEAASGRPDSNSRVKSIDAFRGAALCIMVFVNYGGTSGVDDMGGSGGGNYWFFDHSAWFGLTVADLVFPWFLWTMGVGMALSLAGQRRRGVSKWTMTRRLLARAAKLAVLGIAIIDNASDLSNARIPGVLQYFAVATVLVGLSEVWLPRAECNLCSPSAAQPSTVQTGEKSSLNTARHVPGFAGPLPSAGASAGTAGEPLLAAAAPAESAEPTCLQGCCGDILPHALQFLFFGGLLALYLVLQFFLPVPGCPTGYTGPGGIGDFARHPHCTGGAHRYIDLQLWGLRHMFHATDAENRPISGATCANIYKCDVYDPEGTLGALTASFMAFLGLLAGRMMVNTKRIIAARRRRGAASGDAGESIAYHLPLLQRWAAWGVVLCAIGAGLSGASQNEGVLPLSKNLWSPSFVVTLAGMAFLSVTVLYITMDTWHLWSGSPFVYVGSNSILVYVGSEVLQYYFPFTITPYPPVGGYGGPIFRTHTMALVSNMIGVGTWMLIAYALYQAKVFVKL